MPLTDSSIWTNAGSIGIGGLLTYCATRFTGKIQREAQRDKIVEEVMEQVRKDNEDLRAEVAECRKRDGEVIAVRTCLQLLVPEMIRVSPNNPVLRQLGRVLIEAYGPPDTGIGSLRDLLRQVDAISEDQLTGRRGETRFDRERGDIK